jgi:predicted nucleic acid-binding protein
MKKSSMQGKPSKVVLDTNIVISAAISSEGNPAKIFEMLINGKIENFATT